MKFVAFITAAYGWLLKFASFLPSPLLLLIRLYWGYQFMMSGYGKLKDFGGTVETFRDTFQLPFPEINAALAAGTEFVGGIFLIVGFASRAAAIPLAITMIIAYLTADKEAVQELGNFLVNLWTSLKESSTPDKFTSATPFLFLFASVIVLAFGPGAFSIDHLLARKYGARRD